MKAILVIDVRDNINKYYADLFKEDGKFDEMIGRFYRFRPLPEKKELTNDLEQYVFAEGWNACFDEILGETE